MKKETGITIVALVVTIVVMLILVGVSVTVSINGGLFNTTKESTYKTEVSQVKEALEEEIVQRKARRESVDNITIEDLDIPNKIRKEFKEKLVFNTKIGDILYNPETVTKANEMDWLEDVNIYPTTIYFTINKETVTGFSEKGYEAIKKGMLSFNIPKKTKDGMIITTIGNGAFDASVAGKELCANVKSINIQDNITTIGSTAFKKCTGIEEMIIPESVAVSNIGSSAIGRYAFQDCKGLKNVTILGKVGTMDYIFCGCSNLEEVTLKQDEGIAFRAYLFSDCTKLKYIKLPKSVTWFDDGLFTWCTNLEYVEIPEDSQLNSINGWQAFYRCDKLSHIHLPISMTKEGAKWDTRCGFIKNGSIDRKVYLPITREEYPSHWEGTALNLTNTNIIYKGDEGWHSAAECPNKR